MDTSKTKFNTIIQYDADTKDYFIEIPEEITKGLNWQEGDEIDWKEDGKGYILSKVEDSAKSRKKSRETNITEAKVEDWEKFWYEESYEGEEFGFH